MSYLLLRQPPQSHYLNHKPPSARSGRPDQPTTIAVPSSAANRRPDTIRHLLLGSPAAVRHTIARLHALRYSDPNDWSIQMPMTDDRLMIVVNPGEVMSLLIKTLWIE